MNVGYLKRKSYKNADGEEIYYIGGTIMIPFLRPIEVVMFGTSAEDRQKNKDFPGFHLALQKPKGYEGSRQIIDALWGRRSKDGTKSYLSGFIETPAVPGYKVYIALFNAGENSKEGVLYDVAWNAPRRSEQQDIPPSEDANTNFYEDDQDIPF